MHACTYKHLRVRKVLFDTILDESYFEVGFVFLVKKFSLTIHFSYIWLFAGMNSYEIMSIKTSIIARPLFLSILRARDNKHKNLAVIS